MLRQLLRSVGPREFCLRTVDSGRYTSKKLLTAFGIKAPAFLEDENDAHANEDAYLSLLTLAISRELSKRAKLLQYNTLDDAVNLLRTSRNIMVITGAGISTSLGIPDFRSKGTGLYAKLERMGLHLDPTVFYTVAKEIVVKINRHSPTHAFIAMLDRMGKLLTNYSQNIDNIEGLAGVSPDRLIQCHGSFATATCLSCGYRCNGDDIFPDIRQRRIPRCPECLERHQKELQQQRGQSKRASHTKRKRSDNGDATGASTPSSAASSTSAAPRKRRRNRNAYGFDLEDDDDESDDDALAAADFAFDHPAGIMKPDIIFFGEGLPDAFGERLAHHDRDKVDLVLVIGTSMKVTPVSEIVSWLPPHVPQICISLEPITHINFDIDLVGECDVVVAELCRRAGWTLRHDMVPDGQVVDIESEPGFPHRHRFTQVYPPKVPKMEDPEGEDDEDEVKVEEEEKEKKGRDRRIGRNKGSLDD
ncbi:hypothetical protein ACRALDRAFT_2042173 [Sodiomyces alcalophilus JCM 7366]|uniref:uncharacterized protein n=1 Tax=Sodiomyces alcalophilus JCM 7366 TaxID=591952 RepID=UPI0039B6D13C